MAQIQQQLLAYLPPSVKAFIEGGSRRELLKQIDVTLLVFDDKLIHVESTQSADIAGEGPSPDAKALAAAGRRLLNDQQNGHSVLLLLPPSEFVTTTRAMPGVTRDSLAAAMRLQTDSMLPAFAAPLAMAVNPASADAGTEHVALWLPQQRMVELFDAFEAQGLFIAAVKPRVLGIPEHNGRLRVVDYDHRDTTAVTVSDGIIQRWLQMATVDFEQDVFSRQWQQQVFDDVAIETGELRTVESYLEQLDDSAHQEYSFFPAGALNARSKVEKGRRLMLAAAVAVGLMILSAVPFILQSVEFRRAAAALAANREMSVEARQDQAAVVNFENQWGPISDFPRQNVREAMYSLQNVLSPNQLSSMEITEGLIRIQGSSDDPQAILQRLEQDSLFTEVVFSRATNNARYYIELRLSTVNFEGYMVRYFPDG